MENEQWTQTVVMGAFPCDGIWITMLTLETPFTSQNKEVHARNCVRLRFCDYDRHYRGQQLVVVGGAVTLALVVLWCVPWCLGFHSSEFLGMALSHRDLFLTATQRHCWPHTSPHHKTDSLAGRAMNSHNGCSLCPAGLQKFAFDRSSREVTLQKRNK